VLAKQGHTEVVDADVLGEFERTVDDVVGVDGTALTALPLLCGRLLGHRGHLHRFSGRTTP
jgi:hypothetical protein